MGGWIRAHYERFMDATLASFNRYLASRDGFVHATILSFGWVGGAYALLYLRLPKIEEALIFAYLAFATAFSFITQFNVTHVAERAARIAELARVRAEAADTRILEVIVRLEQADESNREVLLALRVALENQRQMLAAVVELAERDIALGDRIGNAVANVEQLAADARERHLENSRMIMAARQHQDENAEMVRRLVALTERLADAVLAGRDEPS